MTDVDESTEGNEETEVSESEPQNISDLFNDDDSEAETEKVEAEEESEKGDTDTDDKSESDDSQKESGDEDESEESESEPPSDEGESVPRKALLDERRKRQELEQELQKYKQPEEEELPDPTDDPEGYEKALKAKWEKEKWQETANKSRKKMMESVTDYEDKESHFLYLVQRKPELAKEMQESSDPAKFAYDKAKEDLESKEKAVEERVIERLRKEGKLKEDKPKKGEGKSAVEVPDLTNATSAGNNSDDQVTLPDNPEGVFDDLKY